MLFIQFCYSKTIPVAVDPEDLPNGVQLFDAINSDEEDLKAIYKELDMVTTGHMKDGYYKELAESIESFLSGQFDGRTFKCSTAKIRTTIGHTLPDFHTDNGNMHTTSEVIRNNPLDFTKDVNDDPYQFDEYTFYNFWAVLGPTIDYPLGFAPDAFDDNMMVKSKVDFKAYYSERMTLGQFYIFSSHVPHARLYLHPSGQYNPTIDLGCLMYKDESIDQSEIKNTFLGNKQRKLDHFKQLIEQHEQTSKEIQQQLDEIIKLRKEGTARVKKPKKSKKCFGAFNCLRRVKEHRE